MENLSIEGLKKIRLDLESGDSPSGLQIHPDAAGMEFIFGIGTGGLSPFEYELFGKRTGDSLLKEINPTESRLFFEHIPVPVDKLFDEKGRRWFKATIRSVSEASPREIVRAMAAATEGGCGGGCGCGCGG